MFCISVSFKKTPLDIRQRFAFSWEEQEDFLKHLKQQGIITGGVMVSTCNRSEIYFTGTENPVGLVEKELSAWKQIETGQIKTYCLYYTDAGAVRHLFKVACGLDSMVLGEDEILHQVKEAYLFANNHGYTNSDLNIIFQGAFNCAKLSKSSTRLSNTPVSIGTLTANTVENYLRVEERQQGSGMVLVIGATGKIGSIVAKDLTSKGISVIGTSRKHHKQEGVFLTDNIEWVDFESRYDYVQQADAIVSATASPHYTLTLEEFQKKAEQGKRQLLIDLAVPYDMDKEIGTLSGITLLDMDYYKALSKENRHIKLGELDKAEHILEECAEEVLKKLYLRDFKEKIGTRYEEEWFRKMTCYLREVLDSGPFLEVLQRICDKEEGEK